MIRLKSCSLNKTIGYLKMTAVKTEFQQASFIQYIDQELYLEEVSLKAIAEQYGSPTYVYSHAALTQAYQRYAAAFGSNTHICYAVKANANLAILQCFAQLGAGFDIVSGGELERVLAAGGHPNRVVFSGVGKTEKEMARALEVGIHCFNVESESELFRLNQVAKARDQIAPISLRVNPNIDAKTHPYISTGLKENKFGIPHEEALALYQVAQGLSHLKIIGIDCHIGSQLTELSPFLDALDRILSIIDDLAAQGIQIEHLDIGGGVGIFYQDEHVINLQDYAQAVQERLAGRQLTLVLEPGRSLVGNAGILLTQIEYLKHNVGKNFAIIDAAMNDLMRPALYDAYHEVLPICLYTPEETTLLSKTYDLVGPICETGDFLAKDRVLAVKEQDLLVLLSAGAYGMSMSSNYNTRPRPAEIMVKGKESFVIREREQVQDLFSLERLLSISA